MNADRRLEDLFYSFVRMGLREDEVFQGGADVPLQAETWDALFEMARLQAVSGIFVEGVSRSGAKPGRETWLRWLGCLMQLRGANLAAARKGEEWLGRLREAGMEAEVFKGTSVGRWYPDPLARSCGDIDIVVTGGWEKAEPFLRSLGTDFRNEHGDLTFSDGGAPVELHARREYLYSPFADRRLKRILEADREGRELYAVCLILHFRRHALTYGCGLKQACDIAVMLERAGLDMRRTAALLREAGAARFARALFGFLEARLGVRSFPLPPAGGKSVKILEEIVRRDGYLLKKERERSVRGMPAFRRVASNAAFWARRSARLFRLMPGEAFWFPLFMAWRRIKGD